MKVRECPNCRSLLVQASTVCATCGTHVGSSGLPPPAVPPPPWLDELSEPGADARPTDGGGGPAPPSTAAPATGTGEPAGPGAPVPPGGWIPFDAGAPSGVGSVGGVGGGAGGGGGALPPPPPGAYGTPGWGAGGPGAPLGYVPRQTHPQANTAMVLGILSLVVCGVLAIPAIIIGNRARREIRASGGRYDGESSAKAGVICGWVSVAFSAIGVLAFFAIVMLGTTVEPEPTFEPVPLTIDPSVEYPPFDEYPPVDEFGPTSTTR